MDPKAINLSDVETIHNIDTARMALRWALERLQAHDRTIQELEKTIDDSAKTRKREAESMEAHRSWVEDREKYFKSMENLFTMLTEGAFDIPAYAEKKVALERMRKNLDEARARLEAEFETRRAELEKNYLDLHGASQETARSGQEALSEAQSLERDLEDRRRLLNQDRERQETILSEGMKSLDERQRSFEDQMAQGTQDLVAKRGELENEFSALRAQLQEEDRKRRLEWEEDRHQQQETLSRTWPAERTTLNTELRGQTERARLAEEALRVSDESLREVEARMSDQQREIHDKRAKMMASMTRWRKAIEETLNERLKGLDGEEARREELFSTREAGFRSRSQEWSYRHSMTTKDLAERFSQIEKLRKELINAISTYQKPPDGAPTEGGS